MPRSPRLKPRSQKTWRPRPKLKRSRRWRRLRRLKRPGVCLQASSWNLMPAIRSRHSRSPGKLSRKPIVQRKKVPTAVAELGGVGAASGLRKLCTTHSCYCGGCGEPSPKGPSKSCGLRVGTEAGSLPNLLARLLANQEMLLKSWQANHHEQHQHQHHQMGGRLHESWHLEA